ncbi:MAG: N-acetylglucosamine-specific PTS transporter subunit IIBC [Firmicutes bacterium]|nr:N-acetylglucosamine-specific PTS transporter subunit IIBC [Bacillota bacterium]
MVLKYLQQVGKSLMMPVAVLPAAAILLGVGYAIDPAGWGGNSALASFLVQAGDSILSAMPLLFALGVSYGMTKDREGSAALSGLVGYLIITTLLSPDSAAGLLRRDLQPFEDLAFSRISNAFIGIGVGVISAELYNRFSKTELPTFAAFFSGRRLVPILVAAVMCLVSLLFLFIWPPIFNALLTFGQAIEGLGAFGAAIYGFFNRLLIPIGLHHTLNAVFWFDFAGINDLGYFWAGPDGGGVVGQTGRYMAGFFPVMMFGLPGACLAMYRQAKPGAKKNVYGLLLAAAITSFATGVTEPIEFSFMFVAPLLYLIHAVLTAISMFVIYSLGWIAGFAFSAGLIDLLLSSNVVFAVNWFLIPIFGVFYFFVYYFIFSFTIKKFDLKTPGRDDDDISDEQAIELADTNWTTMANSFIAALGGAENITEVDNCATRIRLSVKDTTLINDKQLKSHGARGVIKPSKTTAQIVIGTKVQFVTDEMKRILNL